MAEDNIQKDNVYSENDPLDINELASLNDDISPEFIEQLQNKVAQNASEFTGKPVVFGKDDSELFEEVSTDTADTTKPVPRINFEDNIDDNFIKKYKAKLYKQQEKLAEQESKTPEATKAQKPVEEQELPNAKDQIKTTANKDNAKPEETKPETKPETQSKAKPKAKQESKKQETAQPEPIQDSISKENGIENLTSGNIVEKPIVPEQVEYNESLDFLDDNVKYSKYVIYVDPENTEFIDSLTVKERKNLINRLLREQDDIAITKRRLGVIQTLIKHSIVAIITVAISIPVIYWTINTSLEASINNYRRSQSIFQTLYKEKGKIKSQKINY